VSISPSCGSQQHRYGHHHHGASGLDECRAWGRGCSPLEHYSTLGSPKVVRGYYGLVADQDLTAHTIDGFASLKVTPPF